MLNHRLTYEGTKAFAWMLLNGLCTNRATTSWCQGLRRSWPGPTPPRLCRRKLFPLLLVPTDFPKLRVLWSSQRKQKKRKYQTEQLLWDIYQVPAHVKDAVWDLSSHYFRTNQTDRNIFGKACSDLPQDATMEQTGELASCAIFLQYKIAHTRQFFQ